MVDPVRLARPLSIGETSLRKPLCGAGGASLHANAAIRTTTPAALV
jgi:hypothetical protein